jgi:inositol phosphorylceramide mannosyltransferase catalytic subunit
MLIPRIIHQTLPDKSRIPAELSKNIATLKAMNPGWRYVLYDDNDIQEFIFHDYGQEIHTIFNSINPLYGSARADLFRYLLIYKVGGVYLDIKSACTKPLDSIIEENDSLLLSYWHNSPGDEFEGYGLFPDDGVDNEFQTWHVICEPNHPVMQSVIDSVLWNLRHYSIRKYGVGRFGVLRTTGPIAYTRVINAFLDQHDYRIFDSHASGLLYSILPGKHDHEDLFKKHYSRLIMPIVSKSRENILHHWQYKLHRLLHLMP